MDEPNPPSVPPSTSRRPLLLAALLGAVAAGVLGLGMAALWMNMKPPEGVPPEAMAPPLSPEAMETGEMPPRHPEVSSQGSPPRPGPLVGTAVPSADDVESLRAELAAHPQDLAPKLKLARALLLQNPSEASQLAKEVLAAHPGDPEARTYEAMAQAAQGQGDAARAELDAVLKEHPDQLDALFFRGMMAMQGGDTAAMAKAWGHYVEVAEESDPRRARLKTMVERFKGGPAAQGGMAPP